MTKQRRAILEVLSKTKSHPSADWVFRQVRRRLPNISLATVYRNLHQLARAGMVQELPVGDHVSRFDADTALHYHIRCLSCGCIRDLDVPVDAHLKKAVSRATDFEVLSHHVEFLGHCPGCARQKRAGANSG